MQSGWAHLCTIVAMLKIATAAPCTLTFTAGPSLFVSMSLIHKPFDKASRIYHLFMKVWYALFLYRLFLQLSTTIGVLSLSYCGITSPPATAVLTASGLSPVESTLCGQGLYPQWLVPACTRRVGVSCQTRPFRSCK